VAYINSGMAYSTHYLAIETLDATRPLGTLDLRAARTAGVKWIATDTACSTSWASKYARHLKIDKSYRYDKGSIVLWRVSY
jgi:hypothetical protein